MATSLNMVKRAMFQKITIDHIRATDVPSFPLRRKCAVLSMPCNARGASQRQCFWYSIWGLNKLQQTCLSIMLQSSTWRDVNACLWWWVLKYHLIVVQCHDHAYYWRCWRVASLLGRLRVQPDPEAVLSCNGLRQKAKFLLRIQLAVIGFA